MRNITDYDLEAGIIDGGLTETDDLPTVKQSFKITFAF